MIFSGRTGWYPGLMISLRRVFAVECLSSTSEGQGLCDARRELGFRTRHMRLLVKDRTRIKARPSNICTPRRSTLHSGILPRTHLRAAMPHRTLLSLSLAFLFVLLLHTPLAAAAPRAVPHQEREADDDDFFAEFTRPRAGDVLVTGSVAEVSWRTGTGEGHVMLEVAEGDPDLRHFVYVDCKLPSPSPYPLMPPFFSLAHLYSLTPIRKGRTPRLRQD